MRKLWKGLLLGAAVGGAVKAVQEVQGEGTLDDVMASVGKAAGQAAAAGAVVGSLLDRRDRRRMTKLQRAKASAKGKMQIGTMVAGAGALADAAMPALHDAAEMAKDRSATLATAAKPRL